MSLKSSFGGEGYSPNSCSNRMGIFSTNSNQHDSGRPGQTNKYNLTNKYSSHTEPHPPQATPADAAKNNSPRNYSYQAQVSETGRSSSSSILRSPALVARAAKISRSKLHNSSDSSDFLSSYQHSRSDSGSSRSSSASTGTVCESEIFPYGRGIKPQQRSLRSTSPPLRTVTQQRTQEKYDASKEMSTNNKVAPPVTEQVSLAELESKSSEKLSELSEGVKAAAGGVTAPGRELTPDLEMSVVVSKDITRDLTTSQRGETRPRMETAEDDSNSVSTVSGSGIDFFRKFVQRKASSCKDCEEQFRREVLIDRLVSDSIKTKAIMARTRSGRSSTASSSAASALLSSEAGSTRPTSELTDSSHNSVNHSLIVSSLGMHEIEQKARGWGCASRCKTHRNNMSTAMCDEVQSVSTKSSLSRSSSISGSGLLFLRNYLKKKKSKSKTGPGQSEVSSIKDDAKNISAFNIVPVPFPPPSDFYGPAYFPDSSQDPQESLSEDTSSGRRHSLCSTVADLLNEDFDCDDSELKNLDWEEWDEPLPDEMSYDDLVSVISESFYSEEVDISELCELDWEGRKTVVAAEHQVISTTPSNSRGLQSNLTDYKSPSPQPTPVEEAADIPLSSSKSKYSSRSSTFLQDLEAELALPPMTPVSDEKEEAVRALSRSIKQYMRTGSNSSYTSCGSSGTGPAVTAPDRRHSRLSSYHNEQGRYSRKSTGEELERNSRMSVYSPAMSDYLPELVSTNASSSCASPLQGGVRRPLSQLLMYDCPPESDKMCSPAPASSVRPSSQMYYCYDNSRISRMSRERSKTPSPELRMTEKSNRANSIASGYIFSHQGKAADLASASGKLEAASGTAGHCYSDSLRLGPRPGSKAANRDSLLCPYSPPLCASPGLQGPLGPGLSPNVSAPPRHFIRHSSTDSGCHLLEEKMASASPTPSPRTNIETVLNNNRNKLASFWEKSVSNSVADIQHSWLPNKEGGPDDSSRHGFKPFKSAFGSENSLIVTDRLNHFQDLTRRAAERNVIVGRPGLRRAHRASTGSDCSDFLDKITLSPAQPRRRESVNEYFV